MPVYPQSVPAVEVIEHWTVKREKESNSKSIQRLVRALCSCCWY
jgi:hypothetical protein